MASKLSMTWAERAKAAHSKEGTAMPTNPTPSSQLAQTSTAFTSTNADMSRINSTRSLSSNSSIGQNTGESVTTDNTRPGTESEDLMPAPSTATTSSIADSDTVDAAKTGLPAEAPAPPALQPAPIPPVNVWAARKEKMAQERAVLLSQSASVPSTSSTAPAPPQETKMNSISSGAKPSNIALASVVPAPASRPQFLSKHEVQPMLPNFQRDPSKPGSAKAPDVTIASVPAANASHSSSISAPGTALPSTEAGSWPTPVEDALLALPTSIAVKPARSTSDDNESRSGESTKGERRKGKWIPIQADITVKPSLATTRRTQVPSAERRREQSTESRTGRGRNASVASSLVNGSALSIRSEQAQRTRDLSSGSSQVSSPENGRPQPNGLVANDLYSTARSSPEFLYPSSRPPINSEPHSSQASSSHIPSSRSSQKDLDGGSERLAAYDEAAIQRSRVLDDSAQVEARLANQLSQQTPHTGGFRGRGGRHRGGSNFDGRQSFYDGRLGKFDGRANNHENRPPNNGYDRFPQREVYTQRGNGNQRYDAKRPRSPDLLPASPTFLPTQSMHGYIPAPPPMYTSPDLGISQGAFQPYPYAPAMSYGYPPPLNGQYMTGDPNAPVMFMPVEQQRPMPQHSHLLFDPPMDETSFWVLGQLEYYLSEDNLARDTFLREHMDAEGWVSIPLLASFNRVKALSQDPDLIRAALHRSSEVEVSGDGTWVRRRGDWFRWVLPTAKPSEATSEPHPMPNGITSMPSEPASVPSVPLSEVLNGSAPVSPRNEIKFEAIPILQGMNPHSQPTLLIGGDGLPPRHHKHKSPPARASQGPSSASGSPSSQSQLPPRDIAAR